MHRRLYSILGTQVYRTVLQSSKLNLGRKYFRSVVKNAAPAMDEDSTGGTCDWLHIRNMMPDDIGQVLDMWKEQDWSRDRDFLSIFYQVDPDGFFVAVDTRTGKWLSDVVMTNFALVRFACKSP
ncbi:hypothetical protein ISCGN_017766 [Ixodes scapularis]